MVAIGEPFIQTLIENNLSLREYFILYCKVYDKEHLIDKYQEKFTDLKLFSVYGKLVTKGFLLRLDGDKGYISTEKGDDFIYGLVDSYADQKSDNPFLGDEDITEISDSVYDTEFKKFLDAYPVKIRRTNGTESYLKEGTKEIKELYVKIITGKRATPQQMQDAIEYYVRRYTDSGNLPYLKTLKNWLLQEIWRDVLGHISGPNYKPVKTVNYGGKIE
jgi:hypothetical protein